MKYFGSFIFKFVYLSIIIIFDTNQITPKQKWVELEPRLSRELPEPSLRSTTESKFTPKPKPLIHLTFIDWPRISTSTRESLMISPSSNPREWETRLLVSNRLTTLMHTGLTLSFSTAINSKHIHNFNQKSYNKTKTIS